MKKTLSIILTVLMLVTMIPFTPVAFAADDYAVVNTEAGTVTIDGTLGGKTTATEDDVNALVEQLKGYVDSGITTIIVTGSEPALHNFYGIDTSAVSAALYYLADGRSDSPYCGTIDLILPDVTEIVDDEFNNTFALNSITLPKVTTVGDGAFYATLYLKKLTFGSVITFVNEKSSGPFHMDGYEVGGCDLVLNCGQLQAEDKYKPNFETNVWFVGDWSGEYEWKSITLTHTGGNATCTAKAVCETCGVEYGDMAPDAHDIVIDKAVAPDCANTGLTQGEYCTRCDYKVEQEVVPALNHKDTLVQVEAKAKTCAEIGWDAYEYCTACDYSTYEEIPASHEIKTVDKKDATCTEVGHEAYEYCTECDYTTYEEIPSNGHTPLEAVKENEVAPECEKAGSYDLVVYCDVCDEELDRDTATVEALTHTDADGNYLCDNGCGTQISDGGDGGTGESETPDEPADDVCADCGKVHTNFFSEIICFFTRIINFIKNLFA